MRFARTGVLLLLAATLARPSGAQVPASPPVAPPPPSTTEAGDAEVLRLNRVYAEAYARGDYNAALTAARQALSVGRARLAPADSAIPVLLSNVAVADTRLGHYAEAEPLYRQAIDLLERQLGRDHQRTLFVTNNLAALYTLMSRPRDAEPLLRRILAAQERTLGRDHPDTLMTLANLATTWSAQGRLAEAAALAERALRGWERARGADSPETIRAANNLGDLYQSQARYAEADALLHRALQASERVNGPEHPETLQYLANLAGLYHLQGRFLDAEPLLTRALAAEEGTLGRDHPQTILTVSNLAALYGDQGRDSEAEPLAVRAEEASTRILGADHAHAVFAARNLAELYARQLRYVEAESLYQRLLAVAERALGRDNPQVIAIVQDLAQLYCRQARYAEAEALLRRALEARERSLGRDHPDTLETVGDLARLYQSTNRPAEAERLYLRAVRTRERRLGRDDPNTIVASGNLGDFYWLRHRFADAERRLAPAFDASRRRLGADHPAAIAIATDLAVMRLQAPRRHETALAPARQLVAGLRARRAAGARDSFAARQAEREQLSDSVLFTVLADASWSAGEANPGERASLTAEAFTALQDSAAGSTDRALLRAAVRHLADQGAARLGALVREREDLDDRWRANNILYGQSVADPIVTADGEALKGRLRAEHGQIETRMAAIDAILHRDFPQYFDLTRPEPLGISAAQALLAPDEAILLVVPTSFGTHVMAIGHDDVRWARSSWTRGQIDQAVIRLLWDVGGNVQVSAAQSALWERQAGPGLTYDRGTAFALYNQIVAPVAALLEGKSHVFIAAADTLRSLPFGILVAAPPQGANGDPQALRATRWFADAHALTVIPSIQSLQFLRRYAGRGPAGNGSRTFVGFGDPLLQGSPVARATGRGTRSGTDLADVRQLRQLNRLPGTAAELQSMRQALSAPSSAVFLGRRATEARLRGMDLSRASIIALATHGLLSGELRGATEPGLVLTPPDHPGEADDGYLSSSEISALRLNADWVILSACNTAAGDGTRNATGLSGLARAFFYAGARNLLASHWPVRDDVAARLTVRMIALLRANPRLSRDTALQQAMREVREDRSHDSPEDSWAHPGAWAPFSLIGDGAH